MAIHQLPNNLQALELRSVDGQLLHELYRSKPMERMANPSVRENTAYFSVKNNKGQEEILALNLKTGVANAAIAGVSKGISYTEKDPFPAQDGSLYFIGNYLSRSATNSFDVYRYQPGTKELIRVAQSSSGLLLHPALHGSDLIVSNYRNQGMDLYRVDLNQAERIAHLAEEEEDLHHFLSGGEIPKKNMVAEAEHPPSVPYSAVSTPATSLWPQYWMPMADATYNGALLGASTSGNDPLDYRQYSLTALYDTRADFPTFDVSYLNRQGRVNFQLEGSQSNDYFQSIKVSNPNSLYSLEAIYPGVNYFNLNFGTAYQERELFGGRSRNMFFFDETDYQEIHSTPSAIAPNRGGSAGLYAAFYPATKYDDNFADVRSSAGLYFEGFVPSHSFSATAHFAISTNHFLLSNYYLGGGASTLSTSNYIVRGYPQDTLFGTRIATANFAYTLPLSRPFSGWGTNPFFLRNLGLRFMLDAGSADYLSTYDANGNFIDYNPQRLGQAVIFGTGADFIAQTSLFYYIPVELDLGIHRGLERQYGGETLLYLGLSLGSLGGVDSKSKHF